MKLPSPPLLSAALGLLSALSLPAQTTLLNDTFADGERTILNLPGSTSWVANNPGNVSTGTGGITVSNVNSSGQSVGAQFMDGSVHTIGVGESLTLSFSIAFNGAVDSGTASPGFAYGLRIGLFNVNGTEASDGIGINNALWNPLTGYFAAINVGHVSSGTDPIVLAERASVGSGSSFVHLNHVVGGSAQPYYSTLDSGGTNNTFDQTASTFYTASLTLSRTATNTMNVAFSLTGSGISGFSYSADDTTTPYTSFDILAIGAVTGTMNSFIIDNVSVSSVPEPSTYAMLAGLGALGLAFWQRRRGGLGRSLLP